MNVKPAFILVTDDESNIRLMLRTALASEGYEVAEAADGQQALDAIGQRVPDLMVLDLSMPVMDGMTVLEQMKTLAADKKPRVIVLTAYGSIPAAVKACRLGAVDFLEKPITPRLLRQTVAEILGEPIPPEPAMPLAQFEKDYAGVLDRVRKALRMADYDDAEALLARAADLSWKDPAYYNLLGILYESRRRFRLARKFFNRALDVRPSYEPALMNLRRLAELQSRGRASTPLVFGDSVEDELWMAKLPDSTN